MVAARALAKDFIPASPPSSSLSLMHFFKPMVDKRSPPSLSSMWPFTYHAFSLWPLCSCPISITFALHAARTSEHVLTSDHFEQTSRQKPTIRLLCKKSMTMEGGKSWYYAYMFKVWFKSPNYFWTLSTPTIYINEVKNGWKNRWKKVGQCTNRLLFQDRSHAERVYIQWKTAMAVSRLLVFGCHRDSLSGAMGVHILSQQNLCHYPTVTRVSHQSLRYLCAYAHRIYQ